MTIEELKVVVSAEISDLQKKMDSVEKEFNDFQTTAQKTTNDTMSNFKALASGIAALGIGKIVKESISIAMESYESESLFETSLGALAGQAREWSNELENSLGLNGVELRRNAGLLYTMTSSMGLAQDQAYDMSTALVELSADMASFYNMSSDEAFAKLKSGLTGEAEPLKALGILIDDNTIKQYAYAQGIADVGAELTQQEKVLARYAAIMGQTTTAQGDLARTIDSPANQLRLLQNELNKAKLAAGQAFLPLVQTVLPAVTKGISTASPYIASFCDKISDAGQYIANLNPVSKAFLKVMLASIVAYPAITLAIKALTMAKAGLLAIQSLLIPKTITLGAVMKASFGWIAIAAGAMALFTSLAGSTDNIDETTESISKLTDNIDKTTAFTTATDDVEELTGSVDELKSKVSNLAGFDKINILSSSDSLLGSLITDSDLDNLEEFSMGLGDINELVEDFEESVEDAQITSESAIKHLAKATVALISDLANGDFTSFWGHWADGVSQILGEDVTFEEVTRAGGNMISDLANGNFTSFWQHWLKGVNQIFGSDISWDDVTSGAEAMMLDIQIGDFNSWWDKWAAGLDTILENIGWDELEKGAQKVVNNINTLFGEAGKEWTDFWEGVGKELYQRTHTAVKGEKPVDWEEFNATHTRAEIAAEMNRVMGTNYTASDIKTGTDYKSSSQMSKMYENRYKQYAAGGFPDYGEIFVANESGAELVGKIGNKTAVANQYQIIEGISAGVETVMARYMSQKSGDTYVFIDGDEVETRIEKRQASRYKRTGGGAK